MVVFLIILFLYILLRFRFRSRHKRAGTIYLVGSRIALLPGHVKSISIIGVAGIALLIVIITIMGYDLTSDQLARLLTLGVLLLSIQVFPLVLFGDNGIVCMFSHIKWNDIRSVRLQDKNNAETVKLRIGYRSSGENTSIDIYISSGRIQALEEILGEMTSVRPEITER